MWAKCCVTVAKHLFLRISGPTTQFSGVDSNKCLNEVVQLEVGSEGNEIFHIGNVESLKKESIMSSRCY
jgi:hypothetical protein